MCMLIRISERFKHALWTANSPSEMADDTADGVRRETEFMNTRMDVDVPRMIIVHVPPSMSAFIMSHTTRAMPSWLVMTGRSFGFDLTSNEMIVSQYTLRRSTRELCVRFTRPVGHSLHSAILIVAIVLLDFKSSDVFDNPEVAHFCSSLLVESDSDIVGILAELEMVAYWCMVLIKRFFQFLSIARILASKTPKKIASATRV